MTSNEIFAVLRKAVSGTRGGDNLDHMLSEYAQAQYKELPIRYTAVFVINMMEIAFRAGHAMAQEESGTVPTREQLTRERVDLTTRLDKIPKIRCHPIAFARAYLLGAKFALEWVGGKPRKASEFNPDWSDHKRTKPLTTGRNDPTRLP